MSEEAPTRQPKVGDRTSAVVRRSGDGGFSGRSSGSARGMGMGPGTYSSMSNNHVTDFKTTRAKEKNDLQDLNTRLADYIDKVHFLQAQNKKLEAENEALRNRKAADLQPIRDHYEGELNDLRNVNDKTAVDKGQLEGKVVNLQDEIKHLKQMKLNLEAQAKDYNKKINDLGNQLGENEGEIHTLRNRVQALEDENHKLREMNDKIQDSNRRLRSDLDSETAAHIEADAHHQTKAEEAEFYKDLCDQFKMCQPEEVKIKGMDYKDFWKSEMAKALRNMNSAYDEKIDKIQNDCEAKYAAQVNSMRHGNVKDNLQLEKSKDEIKKLKTTINNMTADSKDLALKLANLQAENDRLSSENMNLEKELDDLRAQYEKHVAELENELQDVMAQLKVLMDAKMSLELEIACYKKLLEGEESRVGLRNLVEQASDSQMTGSATAELAEAIKEQQSKLKEATGSLTVQRSSKGALAFKSMDHTGHNVVIENTSGGPRSKTINIKGWRMVKVVNNKNIIDVELKEFVMAPTLTFTLWAKGAKDVATVENEQVAEDKFNFGVGTCVWKLVDDSGNDKAQLVAKFTS